MTPTIEKKTRHCVACGNPRTDRAHIKSRGAGGTQDDWNIMPLCRAHHVEQHKLGWITFLNRYQTVKNWLIRKGWEVTDGLFHSL